MFVDTKPKRKWSDIGLVALIVSIVGIVITAVLDGWLKGRAMELPSPVLAMIETWVLDFRYTFDQGLYAATVFFVGAKFFETRTVFTIAFDTADASKMLLKGPDENNVVWVGHVYSNKLEAEAVSEAIAERLRQSMAA